MIELLPNGIKFLIMNRKKREVRKRKTILYLHDGGYYFLCKESHRSITSSLAKK
ncbi:hypothetical protein GLOIN_2v1679208 [Rhizophagus irregularis DAOM 181602=DAOM 197198]|uniref:Uncharacterized protein n=1 Tax=Rhizophagus irregularis (strain DAOM 181602 / DAOM 197198 / MUCL 43194) TaxID=747089 RepID=A0A2P4PF96_RHIID|nr:hypothetical protein GLOIN_2v1679208 [Rhizophagus irregularis DAOM 181602=DAOM 197198]POG64068.1 hypothetical protein GLOIN_2v1679208 [Rhizophagus irregularis DAOM 181602=DAOM 197198]|eukprot:XP_025170934.1 hypothetical protein GLOIN_2v1679208 [Rhizophagus irregularis DAOM 181602=DAOM 197198]